ncbi:MULTISPECIES: antitoxin [Streptomyces]|uniref:Antitoxin n=1 Tax=Streptomyces solicathayae TaxID=3081768 RepID=A0ABZ0LWW2_9ACTN|nr:antitoxin [Streptomyces sp. HUAS YS2]WOX23958.1 antitoxin [Streptomyces sp. HUAS YS2]
MGIMDKLKGMMGQHPEKARQASDAAERKINEKTGDKYTSQVDQAQRRAEGSLGMTDKPEQPPT